MSIVYYCPFCEELSALSLINRHELQLIKKRWSKIAQRAVFITFAHLCDDKVSRMVQGVGDTNKRGNLFRGTLPNQDTLLYKREVIILKAKSTTKTSTSKNDIVFSKQRRVWFKCLLGIKLRITFDVTRFQSDNKTCKGTITILISDL